MLQFWAWASCPRARAPSSRETIRPGPLPTRAMPGQPEPVQPPGVSSSQPSSPQRPVHPVALCQQLALGDVSFRRQALIFHELAGPTDVEAAAIHWIRIGVRHVATHAPSPDLEGRHRREAARLLGPTGVSLLKSGLREKLLGASRVLWAQSGAAGHSPQHSYEETHHYDDAQAGTILIAHVPLPFLLSWSRER